MSSDSRKDGTKMTRTRRQDRLDLRYIHMELNFEKIASDNSGYSSPKKESSSSRKEKNGQVKNRRDLTTTKTEGNESYQEQTKVPVLRTNNVVLPAPTPITAFSLFLQSKQQQHPEDGSKNPCPDSLTVSAIAALWTCTTPQERKIWKKRAEQAANLHPPLSHPSSCSDDLDSINSRTKIASLSDSPSLSPQEDLTTTDFGKKEIDADNSSYQSTKIATGSPTMPRQGKSCKQEPASSPISYTTSDSTRNKTKVVGSIVTPDQREASSLSLKMSGKRKRNESPPKPKSLDPPSSSSNQILDSNKLIHRQDRMVVSKTSSAPRRRRPKFRSSRDHGTETTGSIQGSGNPRKMDFSSTTTTMQQVINHPPEQPIHCDPYLLPGSNDARSDIDLFVLKNKDNFNNLKHVVS